MRIINGLYKGKTLNFIKNLKTRPLKNIVRESIFNVLKHSNFINVKINDSNVLDLYSGIGSFGLECLSRGSKKVVFIEQDKIAAILSNIDLLIQQEKQYREKLEKIKRGLMQQLLTGNKRVKV